MGKFDSEDFGPTNANCPANAKCISYKAAF